MTSKSKKYINPYLAGFLLGLLLLFTFYITGHGLGASGAIKRTTVALVYEAAPKHAENSNFYSKYTSEGKSPLDSWIVYMFIGVIIGGFLSGMSSNRLKITTEKGPRSKVYIRIMAALVGGALFGLGAQLGKGCTSGSALTGMAALSTSGFITMMAIFGTAFIVAQLFKRLWL